MNNQTFFLQPFPSTKYLPDVKITGSISRDSNQLAISYQLLGNLAEVAIFPEILEVDSVLSDTPQRQHELWKDTCFEFFLGIKNSERYWEFNLSPTGNWNIYRFDGYRQGMQEEKNLTKLPFDVPNQGDSLMLTLQVDLDSLLSANQTLEVGITTVLKLKDGEVTYWALTHPGPEADFHRRDSFILDL
jgi:hypothetical protein